MDRDHSDFLPNGTGGGGKDAGFNGGQDGTINNNGPSNLNTLSGKRRSDPYYIGTDNTAFDFSDVRTGPSANGAGGLTRARPRTFSDGTTSRKQNQDMLFWKKTEEQLRLRRRLPKSDVQALLDAVGQKRLQRLRHSSSRRYNEDSTAGDDDSPGHQDPDGPYVPSQDSLKKRTLMPPRRKNQDTDPDSQDYQESRLDDIIDLSQLFRTGSAGEKSWGKQMDIRAQLETTPKEKLTGWKKFKHKRSKDWKRAQRRWREILGSLEIWRGSFKAIEGNFGTSVTSYFRFLKWLLGLNVFIMLLLFGVLILTQIFMSPDNFKDSLLEVNRTRYTEKAKVCTDVYDTYVQGVTNNHSTFDEVLDFFSGTGFMERTVLFYGYYFNKTYVWVDDTQQNYNMPVAYIMATTFYFLVSLVLMVKYTARGLKESQLNSGEKFYHSCNKVFCGWDFTLAEEKAAKYKQKNIYDEIMHDLQEQYLRRKQASRTTGEKCKLYSFRLFINIVVITILGSAGYLIYWTSMKTLELAEDPTNSGFETLLIQFLPSIAITVLNFIVPFVFEKVVVAEDYSAEFEVKLTIGRTVILRLASVAVLVLTLGIQLLDCPEEIEPGERCVSCIPNVYCWETYVGQQFFKLVILDFFVVIGVTFLVQYPRKFVVSRYSKYKVFEMVGHQEFEIPKNVLDLVYTQTLCWLGAFYSPLIPAISVLKMFFFFYTKKISLLQTCVPSRKSFRASNIQSFFMTILMLSIVLCIMPIVYTITRVPPSQSCGPFRVWDSEEFRMYEVIGSAVGTLPNVLREIMYFIGTWTFYIPLYIILCLFIYYYMAVAAGNRKMVELLKEQLALEGKDKQFLLGQVRDALMRGELNS